MDPQQGRDGLTIAAVSRLTGVTCHTLRVWERRYGFPSPLRSDAGQRRYPRDQVGVITRLVELIGKGHSIGNLIGEYQAGRLFGEGSDPRPAEDGIEWGSLVASLLNADLVSADGMIDRLGGSLSAKEFVGSVIGPALMDVDERRRSGRDDPFRVQCAISYLLSWLGGALDRARRANAAPSRSVLVGTAGGRWYDEGVLVIGLALELAGWRAIPIGNDLPPGDYQRAIDAWRPDALALSFVHCGSVTKRFRDLARIRGVPVFVGGRTLVNHRTLVRRHGLILLDGPLWAASEHLIGEVEAVRARVDDPPRRGVD